MTHKFGFGSSSIFVVVVLRIIYFGVHNVLVVVKLNRFGETKKGDGIAPCGEAKTATLHGNQSKAFAVIPFSLRKMHGFACGGRSMLVPKKKKKQ